MLNISTGKCRRLVIQTGIGFKIRQVLPPRCLLGVELNRVGHDDLARGFPFGAGHHLAPKAIEKLARIHRAAAVGFPLVQVYPINQLPVGQFTGQGVAIFQRGPSIAGLAD